MRATTIHEKGVGSMYLLASKDPEFPICLRLINTGPNSLLTRREARRLAQALLRALKELGPAK